MPKAHRDQKEVTHVKIDIEALIRHYDIAREPCIRKQSEEAEARQITEEYRSAVKNIESTKDEEAQRTRTSGPANFK